MGGSTSTTVSGSRPSWSTRTAASAAARSCSTRSTCPRPTPPPAPSRPWPTGASTWSLAATAAPSRAQRPPRRGRPRLAVPRRGGQQAGRAGWGRPRVPGRPHRPGLLGRGRHPLRRRPARPKLGRPASSLRFAIAAVDGVYGHAVADGPGPSCATAGWRPRPTWPTTRAATTRPRWSRKSRPPGPTCCSWSPTWRTRGSPSGASESASTCPCWPTSAPSSSYCMPEFGALLGRDAVGLFASDKPDTHGIQPLRARPRRPRPARPGRRRLPEGQRPR